jgi:hypothetical protein
MYLQNSKTYKIVIHNLFIRMCCLLLIRWSKCCRFYLLLGWEAPLSSNDKRVECKHQATNRVETKQSHTEIQNTFSYIYDIISTYQNVIHQVIKKTDSICISNLISFYHTASNLQLIKLVIQNHIIFVTYLLLIKTIFHLLHISHMKLEDEYVKETRDDDCTLSHTQPVYHTN